MRKKAVMTRAAGHAVRFMKSYPFFPVIMIFLLLVVSVYHVSAEDGKFMREDFKDLKNWKPLEFPKIKEHTKYSVEIEGDDSILKAVSNASASGIIFRKEFNVFEYSRVKWKWKVSNVFRTGNAEEKWGDDYPLRVYIIFKYDPDKASFGQKIKYGLARSIYGEYPPHSSLNYIWANRKHDKDIIPNPYAKEAMMIPLQTGDANAGRWIEEEINIIEDYHRAFGEDPPATGSLAIMSDSDNTRESAAGYIDYIEVFR